MIKVGVVGASGYTGRELLNILLRRDDVEVTAVTSETHKGKPLASVFPQFSKHAPLVFEGHDPAGLGGRFDSVFLCLPHRESMNYVPAFLADGVKVFDLSADFRLKDKDVYEQWYGVTHAAPELIAKSVYGLPELYKGAIASADLVAVPGCYPTSVILGLAPVMSESWIDTETIVVCSASGVSGAGQKIEARYLLAEMEGDYQAYGAPYHRHTPEMEQELSAISSKPLSLTFIPHLLPTTRGIHSTITVKTLEPVSREEVLETYLAFYRDCRFVTVADGYPRMKWAVNTNGAYINAQVDERTGALIVTSVIDNLVKGAAGQAVQCFNIRHGLGEAKGLA